MTKRIVGIINPMDMVQKFYVYEDGNKIAGEEVRINDVPDTVFSLAQEFDVKEISLSGSKQFNRGISKKIQEKEMTKFGKNELIINLI